MIPSCPFLERGLTFQLHFIICLFSLLIAPTGQDLLSTEKGRRIRLSRHGVSHSVRFTTTSLSPSSPCFLFYTFYGRSTPNPLHLQFGRFELLFRGPVRRLVLHNRRGCLLKCAVVYSFVSVSESKTANCS